MTVSLSGPMLDVSAYFAEPQAQRAETLPVREEVAPPAPEHRGEPWRAELHFAQIQLAKGKILAPLILSAESNGLHVTAADIRAGRRATSSPASCRPAARAAFR